MIFIDTSAIYALADKADPNHTNALKKFDLALKAGEVFLTHNYILVETAALLNARLGLQSALLFLRDAKAFNIEWIDINIHQEALKELEKLGRKGVSLIDCTTLVVMRKRGVKKILAFDPYFEEQGFTIC